MGHCSVCAVCSISDLIAALLIFLTTLQRECMRWRLSPNHHQWTVLVSSYFTVAVAYLHMFTKLALAIVMEINHSNMLDIFQTDTMTKFDKCYRPDILYIY